VVIQFPNASATNIQMFQRVQNEALRIATGCHRFTPIAHLYTEEKMLPIKNHLQMLCNQFLASALSRSHVSFPVVTLPPGPRKMKIKRTIYDTLIEFVRPYLTDRVMLDINYKCALKALNSAAVAASICENGPNLGPGHIFVPEYTECH
jgi:hypothetical protein